jgi:Flp pilus assembly pilin Flp
LQQQYFGGFMKLLKNKAFGEKGASLIEYAILVALIVVIAIAAIRLLGQQVSTTFSQTAGQVDAVQ